MQRITKITISTIALIFGGMFVHSVLGQSFQNQENRILIYDGESDPRSFSAMRAETLKNLISPSLLQVKPPKYKEPDEVKSARKQILDKSSLIKTVGLETLKSDGSTKNWVNCKKYKNDQIFTVVADGNFTKPNAKQTAYLYKLYFCDDEKQPKEDYSRTIGGIAVFENEEIVVNYVYAAIKFSGLKVLPDINQNGLSEFILAREYHDIDLVEIFDNKVNVFGSFKVVHNYNGGLDGMPYFYNSKKIYAVPGKNLEFFEEYYSQKDSDKTILAKPLQKVSLNSSGDWSRFFRLVK